VSASDKECGGSSGATIWPDLITWRGVLLLAAIDALAWGLAWGTDPGRLFPRLGMEPRHDSRAWQLLVRRGTAPDRIDTPRDAGLWHLLALISVAHAGFLALAAWRPYSLGGLVVVPLIGHVLGVVLWLWALATAYTFPPERVTIKDPAALWTFVAHDALWLPLLVAFLILSRRRYSPRPAGEWGRG
jgi:hypothetical protein